MTSFKSNWTELGLTKVEHIMGCAGLLGVRPCNVSGQLYKLTVLDSTNAVRLLGNFGKKHPAYEPWSNPLYPSSAYIVMGFIIERVSGQTFEEFMQEHVFDPAGMNSTTFAKPDDSLGAIGPDDRFWDSGLGVQSP
jgi:CubicO group peptidase (beta-lactamase class C family)